MALFQKDLVIFTQCHTEYDRCHIFKAMDPLLSFAALPADIKHAMRSRGQLFGHQKVIGYGVCLLYTQLAHGKPRLVNTSGLCSRTEHIVNVGDVFWRSYPFRLLEETGLKQQSSAGYSSRCMRATGMSEGEGVILTMAQSPLDRIHFDAPMRSMCKGRSRCR